MQKVSISLSHVSATDRDKIAIVWLGFCSMVFGLLLGVILMITVTSLKFVIWQNMYL